MKGGKEMSVFNIISSFTQDIFCFLLPLPFFSFSLALASMLLIISERTPLLAAPTAYFCNTIHNVWGNFTLGNVLEWDLIHRIRKKVGLKYEKNKKIFPPPFFPTRVTRFD
uniref:Uncharacterized protein n=1 Tax=Cacopsylla melanoneura TaxID=428564 RepID=A0A8D9E8V8_9HEMI